jgi:hypothetical protein
MIKTLSAIAISAFVAVALFVLPGFAPRVEAEGSVVLKKSDRLAIHTVERGCATQTWPKLSAACLSGNVAGMEPRLVSADRG